MSNNPVYIVHAMHWTCKVTCWRVHVIFIHPCSPKNLIKWQWKRAFLWRFNVAGNIKMYLRLQKVCPIITKLVFFRQIFIIVAPYQISRKFVHRDPRWYVWAGRRTDRHEANKRFTRLPKRKKKKSRRGVMQYIMQKLALVFYWFGLTVV